MALRDHLPSAPGARSSPPMPPIERMFTIAAMIVGGSAGAVYNFSQAFPIASLILTVPIGAGLGMVAGLMVFHFGKFALNFIAKADAG